MLHLHLGWYYLSILQDFFPAQPQASGNISLYSHILLEWGCNTDISDHDGILITVKYIANKDKVFPALRCCNSKDSRQRVNLQDVISRLTQKSIFALPPTPAKRDHRCWFATQSMAAAEMFFYCCCCCCWRTSSNRRYFFIRFHSPVL